MIYFIQQEAVSDRHSYIVWQDYVYLCIYSDKKKSFKNI